MSDDQPAPGEIQVVEAGGGHEVRVWDGEQWQPIAGGAGPAPPEAASGVLDAIMMVAPQWRLVVDADQRYRQAVAALHREGPGR